MNVGFPELDALINKYSKEIEDILFNITDEEIKEPKILENTLLIECNIRTNKLNNFIHENYPLLPPILDGGLWKNHPTTSLNALAQLHLNKRDDEFEFLCSEWLKNNVQGYSPV